MIHWWTEVPTQIRSPDWYRRVAGALATPGNRYLAADPAQLRVTLQQLLQPTHPVLFGDCCTTLGQWALATTLPDRPLLTDAARLALLASVLSTTALQHFRDPALGYLSTSQLLLRGIGDLLRAGVTPDGMMRLARDHGDRAEQDLAHVAAAYLNAAESAGIEPATLPPHALRRLAAQAPAQAATWIIDCGNGPHPLLPALLATLQQSGATVHCLTPSPDTLPAFSTILRDSLDAAPRATEEMSAVAPAAVTHATAADPVSQYRAVAVAIRDALNHGFAPEQLGLVCGDVAAIPLLWQELAAAGLLHHEHAALSLSQRHWYQRILHLSPPPRAQHALAWLDHAAATLAAHAATLDAQHGPIVREAIFQELLCRTWQATRQAVAHLPAPLEPAWARQWLTQLAPPPDWLGELQLASRIPIVSLRTPPATPVKKLWWLDATEQALPIRPPVFFRHVPTDADQHLALIFPGVEPQRLALVDTLTRWQHRAEQMILCTPRRDAAGRETSLAPLCTAWLHDTPPARLPRPAYPGPVPPDLDRRVTQEQTLLAALAANEPPALLHAADVRAHIAARYADREVSASELEQLATCPFAYFAAQLLQLRATPAATPDLLPQTRGEWIHQLLARLYRDHLPALRALGPLDRTAQVTQLRALLLTLLPGLPIPPHRQHRPDPVLTPVHTEHLLREVIQCVQIDLALWRQPANASLQPCECEWRFGRDTPHPLELATPHGPVALRGTIDRIDRDATTGEMLIYDYKSGKTESVVGKVKRGEHCQLPIYLLAVRHAFPAEHVIGALLIGLRHGERTHGLIEKSAGTQRLQIPPRTTSLLSGDAFDALLDTAITQIGELARQIRHVDIPLAPHTCDWCDWRGVSRHEVAP